MRIYITSSDGQTHELEVHPNDEFGNVIGRAEGAGIPQQLLVWVAPHSALPQPPVTSSVRFCVRTLAGKEIWMHAQPSSNVHSLKERLELCEGVPARQQRLIFNGGELEGGRSLSECGVVDDSRLVAVYCLPDAFQIYLQPVEGERIEVHVTPSDSVLDVKRLVEEREGIAVRWQRLLLRGRRLKDHCLLSEYSMVDGTCVQLVLCRPSEMCVVVRLPSGAETKLQVELAETVEEVKAKIAEVENISAESQRLLHKGRLMPDAATLFALGVKKEETVRVLPCRSASFPVYVYLLSGDGVFVEVEASDSAEELKALVEDSGLLPGPLRLFLDGRRLHGRRSLHELGIMREARLRAVPDDAAPVEVTVEGRRRLSVPADRSQSVLELKQRIVELAGLPARYQRLRLGRRVLRDEDMLSNLNLQEASVELEELFSVVVEMLGRSRDVDDKNLFVSGDDSVEDMKREFLRKMEEDQRLFRHRLIPDMKSLRHLAFEIKFKGKNLEAGKKLRECGVVDGSRLTLDVHGKYPVRLAFCIPKTHLRRRFSGSDPHEIKKTAPRRLAAVGDTVVFVVQHALLGMRQLVLKSYDFAPETSCESEMMKQKKRKISLDVSILLKLLKTVKDIKFRITNLMEDFPVDKLLFVYSGKLLDDRLSIEDCNFSDGASLHVIRRASFSAAIRAEGKLETAKVDLSCSVGEVTRLVGEMFGIAQNQQNFVVTTCNDGEMR